MKSLKELYKIGKGPSSSHTMGPQKASMIFLERNRRTASFEVTLYGSLAATGKGHMTDVAIKDVLQSVAPVNIIWRPQVFLPFHPNGMKFRACDERGTRLMNGRCIVSAAVRCQKENHLMTCSILLTFTILAP